MLKYILDLFNKSKKGDNYRTPATVTKYTDFVDAKKIEAAAPNGATPAIGSSMTKQP